MPFVNIMSAHKIGAADRNTLQLEIANNISLLPGKNIDNTVVAITDSYDMFRSGKPLDGIFVDIRLYKASPEDAKKAMAEKLFEIFDKVLGVPNDRVQLNFTEMPAWASKGNYF